MGTIPSRTGNFDIRAAFGSSVASVRRIFPMLLRRYSILTAEVHEGSGGYGYVSIAFHALSFEGHSRRAGLRGTASLASRVCVGTAELFGRF